MEKYAEPSGLFSEGMRFFCLFATAATVILLIFANSTQSRTWYIKADGTGDAPTIQAGVDSAVVGDTVLVGPGAYSDTTHVTVEGTVRSVNVHVRRQVSLLGDPSGDRPLIDGAVSYVGIFVENVDSMVVIGHLKLRRAESQLYGSAQVEARGPTTAREYPARIRCHSSSVLVYDTEIIGDHDGIFLLNSRGEVRDSHFHHDGMAIVWYGGSEGEIHDNVVHDCAIGIWCEGSSASICDNVIGAPPPAAAQNSGISCRNSSVNISGNEIGWSGNGVSASGSDLTIDSNKFTYHNYGVNLGGGSAHITNNLFFHGWLHAIWTASGATGEISNNTIDDWLEAGILSELGASQLIQRNIITRVDWGVVCIGSVPMVECNDIFDVIGGPYDGPCQGQFGNGNFTLDPEYCGVDDSGNYYLQSDSPCAPGNHPLGYECGLIGAFPVHCGTVDTQKATWGTIKNRFKNGGKQ